VEFGHNDTWVNNAAVSMYGRLMDVNFWGQVHGSRTAVRHLQNQGGVLINVASALADRAIPLQGIYCAAKHAVKAFTDSLRMELDEQGLPIAVCLVKPGSIDTPFFEKARTYLAVEPQPVPPVYAPEIVADVILQCAETPVREVIAGGMGKVLSLSAHTPRLADWYMERSAFDAQQTDRPVSTSRSDNLYAPVAYDGGERGRTWAGRTKETSLYTSAVMHPGAALVALAFIGTAVGLALARPHVTFPRFASLMA
jgi:hypothetical protein